MPPYLDGLNTGMRGRAAAKVSRWLGSEFGTILEAIGMLDNAGAAQS